MKIVHALLLASLAALMLAPFPTPWLSGEGKAVQTDREKARPLKAPKPREAWNFAIYGDRTGGPREGLEVLRQAVKDTALLDPDLVMTVGDLVQGYNTRAPWIEEAKEFKGIMDALPMPWYPVAGNHDIYWRGPGRPPKAHEADYEEHFGPLWYWFGHKNAAFIVLYTDEGDPKTGRKGFRREQHIQMSERQIDWLRKTLEQTKRYKHAMVFLHHPRWLSDVYTNTNWPRVHDMLAKAGNVRGVFAGHIHRMLYSGNRDGIEYHVLATVGGHLNANLPQAGFLHHINMVSVREDGLKMSSVPVGEVFDPKSMTPEKLAAAQAVLDGLSPVFAKALALPWTTDVEGEAAVAIKNPSAAAMRLTLHVEPGKGPWIFSPRRAEALIPAGETRTLRFAYHGSKAKAFGAYAAPRLRAHIQLEGKDFRLSFPEESFSFKLELGEAPPSLLLAGPGAANGVLNLSGNGACVAVPGLKLDGGPFTIEGWLRSEDLSQQASFLSKTESSAFGLVLNQNEPAGLVHIGGSYVIVRSARRLKPETWHHLALVYDGTALRIYVDGALGGSEKASGRWRTNSLPFYVGADPGRQGQPTRPLKSALIDEVRVSNTARYKGAKFTPARRWQRDEKTRLLLRFDRDIGPMVLDHSGQGAHGERRGEARCVMDAR